MYNFNILCDDGYDHIFLHIRKGRRIQSDKLYRLVADDTKYFKTRPYATASKLMNNKKLEILLIAYDSQVEMFILMMFKLLGISFDVLDRVELYRLQRIFGRFRDNTIDGVYDSNLFICKQTFIKNHCDLIIPEYYEIRKKRNDEYRKICKKEKKEKKEQEKKLLQQLNLFKLNKPNPNLNPNSNPNLNPNSKDIIIQDVKIKKKFSFDNTNSNSKSKSESNFGDINL